MNLNFLKWRSLKTRVTVFTLAIFLIGIWSLAYYATQILREDMQRLLSDQQFSTAAFVAAQVNGELDDRMRALKAVAENITPAMLGNGATLQTLLEQRPILRVLFNGSVIAVRLDGTAIAEFPLTAGRVGVNYMEIDSVSTALKEGQSGIGRPVMGKKLLAPVFGITVPIRDTHGSVIGALSGVVNLGLPNFLDKITGHRYGKTGRFVVVAARHRLIVTDSDKSRVMETLPAPGVNPFIDRFVQGFEGSALVINAHGANVLASIKRVPMADWYVGVTLPTTEAFAPIQDIQQRVLLATIFLTLLAGSLSWWMLKRQLAPMLAAGKSLAALSDINQQSRPLPITSQDEVGELLGGFNRLLETLRQREEALRKSEQYSRAIIDASPVPLAVNGENGNITFLNRAFVQTVGYTAKDIPSLADWNLRAYPDPQYRQWVADNWREHLERAKGDGRPFEPLEIQVRCKDDTVRTFIGSVTTLETDFAGTHLVVLYDITEHKRLEEMHLQAQKLESLGTLAGGIAHDFNNILAAIKGNAELAAEDVGPDHLAAESLGEIRKASERAAELVRRITAFARPKETRIEEVDLGAVVAEVLKLLRSTLSAAITLSTEFGEDAPWVPADAGQIHEAIVNLTTNAAHAIGPRPGTIEYRLEALDIGPDESRNIPGLRQGRYACLTVKDSGCGMDAATIERIFDAFYTTKPLGEGTGLGLSMVHGIMKAHGGAVTVESTPGKGSSFRLYFPASGPCWHMNKDSSSIMHASPRDSP